jgi:heat shock protein HtpX
MLLVGDVLGGRDGMLFALVFAGVTNLGAWWFSDSIVLRTSGAVPIDDPRLGWLEQDVADLAREAGMPKPRVYWVPSEPSPNAFATGRNPEHGVVAVTAGLLQALDRRQIRAVLAHELGHIKHRDTLTSAVAATVAGAISMLARFGMYGGFRGRDDRDSGGLDLVLRLVVLILAPIAALLVHMAVSRTREYAADARAAAINHDPLALAEALERISTYGHAVPMQDGNPSTHYIANNFAGGLGKLFSTHPPMAERVRRLREMAR